MAKKRCKNGWMQRPDSGNDQKVIQLSWHDYCDVTLRLHDSTSCGYVIWHEFVKKCSAQATRMVPGFRNEAKGPRAGL